jgi:hypothetical protein
VHAIAALFVLAAAVDGGAPPAIAIVGDLVKNVSLSVKELEALGPGPVVVDWSDKAGPHKVKGVRLDQLLLHVGFTEGPMGPQADPKLKHSGLRAVVVATAADGFVAVFSLGELLETLGPTAALVVWEIDGHPLAPTTGPFRIVVVTDKKPSRSLHQLTSLRVVEFPKR